MKLEDQTCTYEQSKRLVENGVVLDTTWYWYRHIGNWLLLSRVELVAIGIDLSTAIPSPNVAELGVLLPCDERFGAAWYSGANERGEIYCHIYNDAEEKVFYSETEAQARAEALIWLIENDYVKAEDLQL